VRQQHEIVGLKDIVENLTKRLDLMTKEVDKLRIRYRYQYRFVPGRKLAEKEINEIFENEKRILEELKKHGYTGE